MGPAERVLAGDQTLVAEDEALRAEVAAHSAAAVLAPLAVGFWDAVALADGHADLVRVREWVGIIAQAYRVRVGVRIRVGVRVYRVRARARTIGLGLGFGLGSG